MVRALPCHGRGRGFEPRPLRRVNFANMFFVYILQSQKDLSFYVGQTDNIERRIVEHNSSKNKYTKNKVPWKLVYKEFFVTRGEAMKRENRN